MEIKIFFAVPFYIYFYLIAIHYRGYSIVYNICIAQRKFKKKKNLGSKFSVYELVKKTVVLNYVLRFSSLDPSYFCVGSTVS